VELVTAVGGNLRVLVELAGASRPAGVCLAVLVDLDERLALVALDIGG